jgi:D-amino-acid dehydrogenase
MKFDVIVAGAGIIGVSVALHLQARGRSVLLVDRRGPGEETSHGNAGLVERSSVVPYAFPRGLGDILRYGLNRTPDAAYHLAHLPKVAGWLYSYWRNSAPDRLIEASLAMLPLVERSIAEHEPLIAAAGVEDLFLRRGWIEVFTTAKKRDGVMAEAAALREHGLAFDLLDGAGVREREPHLSDEVVGGIHWHDPISARDPGAVVRGYADLFAARGGRFVTADARTLRQEADGIWMIDTAEGVAQARDAVLALGPWSNDVFGQLGYSIPLGVKRGYHMHYGAKGNAGLSRSVVHAEGGYVLGPMSRGIRLTTGVEFADRDSPPTPVQLDRTEPMARRLFPLGERRDSEPWLGRRPALPDMRPVIGPAGRHDRLWFAFGHAHHGFTLGPVTGRLLAEMIVGEPTVVDPAPYSAARFG